MTKLEGIVHGMSDADYHARPELSSTGARQLLSEFKGSPKKYQWAQSHPKTSRAFDVGHAAHAKVLGVGAGIVLYPDEHLTPGGNVSTKAATVAWEAEQRDNGFTPVSPDEAARVDAMAEAVLAHDEARPYFEVCAGREVSVFSEIDGVPVRARFDALSEETRNGIYAIDLKTTDDATDLGMTSSTRKWGYDVQQAHYEETYLAATGKHIDRFLFVYVERTAPHEVGLGELEEQWVAMGRGKAADARRIYLECAALEPTAWPGYETKVQTLIAPAWSVVEYEMRYESEMQI